ncbi:MAG TPA: secretion protein [Polyangia bacterium]
MLALTVASAGGCSTAILHGLEEPSANETVAALERVGIGAEKQPDDDSNNNGGGALVFKVRVARTDEARALEQLRSLGLPRERRHGFAEVYGQPSLIPTASEERARYLDALAGEVARTLEIADGVVSARVHLVPEEIDALAVDGRARTPARAAVLIKARGGKIPLAEVDIKKLVAGSVPGLDPAAVAVVVTSAADPAAATGEQWSTLGPLRLAPGSRALLIAALIVGLALLGVMAALLLLTVRRQTAPDPPAARPPETTGA